MHLKRRPLLVCAGSTAAAILAFGTPAWAHPGHPDHSGDGAVTAQDGARDTAQHGQNDGHLPASQDNVRLISKLKLSDVEPEKIADVAVHGDHAYLNAWGGAGATPEERCAKTGVYVVDIGDPREPQEVAFIPAPEGSYPGEGAHVVRINTPVYRGDLLLTNNESCTAEGGVGGFNMYHVTVPARPRVLAEGVRDTSRGESENPRGNLTHSVFAWDAGDKAYAVTTDNEDGKDVDIFDITNPRRPALIASTTSTRPSRRSCRRPRRTSPRSSCTTWS